MAAVAVLLEVVVMGGRRQGRWSVRESEGGSEGELGCPFLDWSTTLYSLKQ